MRDYIRIVTKIRETPWLITPEALNVILTIVDERLTNGKLSDEEIAARLQSSDIFGNNDSSARTDGSPVGVLTLQGPLFGKANLMTEMSGATSLETFSNDLGAMLNDDNISSVILDIDSPGGTSELVREVGEQIYMGRDVKPIYAFANSMAGSAAYWLASQASEVYSSYSGMVGSIGAYTVHEDKSAADAQQGHRFTFISAGKYKTEGNEHQPLSQEAQEYRQEVIDELYDDFVQAIALGRDVEESTVIKGYGQGRMMTATKALEAGMVDGITTFDGLLKHAASQPRQVTVHMPAGLPTVATGTASNTANMNLNTNIAYPGTVTGYLTGNEVHIGLESKEYEHSEPGTGSPPQPRKDEDGSDDIAITQRWRRDPLPVYGPNAPSPNPPAPNSNLRGEGMTPEQIQQLEAIRIALGCSEDEFLGELRVAVEGYKDLQSSLAAATEEDRLQREYPQMWREHQDLLNERRENRAKAFTDTIKTFTVMEGETLKPSSYGLSALAMEYVTQMHLKFSEGTANLEDFENCIKGITQGGFVEYGERGSARTRDTDLGSYDTATAEGVKNIRVVFAQKVSEIQKSDKLEFSAALTEAARRYPELAQAYQRAVPVSNPN